MINSIIGEAVEKKISNRLKRGLDPDFETRGSKGWRYPMVVERKYQREKIDEIRLIERLVRDEIIPKLPAWVAEIKQYDTRQDSYLSDFVRTFGFLKVTFGRTITDPKVTNDAEVMANGVNDVGASSFDNQVKTVLGIAPVRTEPWLANVLLTSVANNVNLIKTLHADTFKDIENVVLDGFQRGRATRDIARDIAKKTGASKNRAKLIAQDQVGKLTSNLATRRSTDLGAKRFVWTTSADERVRASHRALNGKSFTYKDGASVDGESNVLPGQPIRCRCTARVVVSSVGETDSEAGKKITSEDELKSSLSKEKAREKEFRKERARLKKGEAPKGLK